MTESIYWYDLETTGTDPVYDRPLQFAGIRTDLALNEIAEPQNFLCRPADDVVPTPGAILVTGIRMSEVVEHGLSDRDFAARVLEQFTQPRTCVAGFNSLRFDDEFTRQMLYRNFHDPYAREWRSGNSRWDVIDLFRAAQALRPEGLNWPLRDDGTPSFRLEDLALANNVPHSDAHDALADVKVTIEMTRRLKAVQPKLYDFYFQMKDKKAVLQQLYPLGKTPVVHVSSMIPASRHCISIVLPICQHPKNANAIICFDLSMDPAPLLQATPAELERLVFTAARDLEKGEERVALKSIHINRSPFVAPMATLREADTGRLGISPGSCEATASRLIGAPGLVEKIQEVFDRLPPDESDDPDTLLYGGGFFSDADRNVMLELQDVSPEQIDTFTGRFQDERLDEMLFRYRGRNYPDLLTGEEQARWQRYRTDRVGDRLEAVRRELSELLPTVTGSDRQPLEELEDYLARL